VVGWLVRRIRDVGLGIASCELRVGYFGLDMDDCYCELMLRVEIGGFIVWWIGYGWLA
jgi:hypothetical protein